MTKIKMRYLIEKNGEEYDVEYSFWLTTDHPESRDGVPVLELSLLGDSWSVTFPPNYKFSGGMRMPVHLDAKLKIVRDPPRFDTTAQMVADWGSEIERSDEEIEAAKKFCQSWPDGPQVS
jgi:hypothetical protein